MDDQEKADMLMAIAAAHSNAGFAEDASVAVQSATFLQLRELTAVLRGMADSMQTIEERGRG